MRFSSFYALALLPLAGALLSGCGGQEKFANSNTAVSNENRADEGIADAQGATKVVEPASKPGKYGGKITDAVAGDPKTFNLWVSADASSTEAVAPLYSALIERNAYTLEWEAALAELPKVSADGLTWTFQLKPGLKWSDGAPITADDVIFTLDVIYDPKVQTNFAESMKVDVPDGKGGFKRVPLTYKKTGPLSVEFKFPVQYAPARDMLSFAIAPRHKLFKFWNQGQPKSTAFNPAYGPNADVKDLVSSGAWILTQYVPGQRLVYARNPNYWKKDEQGRPLPYLDQQISLIVPDLNTTTLKFLGGETDVLAVQQTDYKTVKAGEAKGKYTVRNIGPTSSTSYLGFNLNMKSKPAKANPELFKLFNDVRFRQAVSQAVDRERIARNVFEGLARPGYGPISPNNKLFFTADVPKFDFNLDEARKKLAEIGLKDGNGDGILELPGGKPVRFNIITNVENKLRVGQATTITSDLKKIGIDASFTPIKFSALISRVDNKPEPGKPYPPFDWEAMVLGFTGGVEPHNSASIWTSGGNLHQWEPYQPKPVRPFEAEIDKLFREGAQEMDETKRKAIYAKFQQIVGENQPLIYTVVPDAISALRNNYGNVKPTATGPITWNIEEIYDVNATRDTP
ncbi:MAG TPA: ABC transporter substrate-binding protein [Abditibacterium sp.]